MEEAIAFIRLRLGRYYDLVIGGFHLKNEVVGSDASLTDIGRAKESARRENTVDVAVQPKTLSAPGVLFTCLSVLLSLMN